MVLHRVLRRTHASFWVAANLAGLCMGSSQAAGRAIVGYLAPPARLAEFFGLWGLAVKAASIFGPLTYGAVTWAFAGNHRLGILCRRRLLRHRPGAARRHRRRARPPRGARAGYRVEVIVPRLLQELSRRDIALIALPLLALLALAAWGITQIEPAPPRIVVMSTGPLDGAYHAFAQRYKTHLAEYGVTLELRPSAGAVENVERLKARKDGVSLALVQGGIASAENAPDW